MRKDMGILHFFVNGVDQGPAAFNIPEHVFGIVGNIFLIDFNIIYIQLFIIT